MACERIYQSFTSSAVLPSYTWRSDFTLDTPQLASPLDGQAVCVQNNGIDGSPSNVILQWRPVTGADFYILQWCGHSSFTGPTLRGKKVVGATFYNLLLTNDIWYGEQVYWRLMAYSNSGGVSAMSDSFNFTYDCGGISSKNQKQNEPDAPTCERYGVTIEIMGNKHVMCCDRTSFFLNLSYICEDQTGATVCTIQDIEWSIGHKSGLEEPPTIVDTSDNNLQIKVYNGCTDSAENHVFEVRVNITFMEEATGITFQCDEKVSILVDCDTGKPSQKPWLQFSGDLVTIAPSYDFSDRFEDPLFTGVVGKWVDVIDNEDPLYDLKNWQVLEPTQVEGPGAEAGLWVASGPVIQFKKQSTAYGDVEDCCSLSGGGYQIGLQALVHLPIPWKARYICHGEGLIEDDNGCLAVDCENGVDLTVVTHWAFDNEYCYGVMTKRTIRIPNACAIGSPYTEIG